MGGSKKATSAAVSALASGRLIREMDCIITVQTLSNYFGKKDSALNLRP
jgi:hypothetical protein